MKPDSVIITPKLTSHSKLPLFLLFSFVCLILLAEGVYYWRMTKGTPKPEIIEESIVVKPGEYVAVQNIDVFESSNRKSPFGYLVTGKRFTVLGQEGEWLNIKNERGSIAWIKSDSTYRSAQEE